MEGEGEAGEAEERGIFEEELAAGDFLELQARVVVVIDSVPLTLTALELECCTDTI